MDRHAARPRTALNVETPPAPDGAAPDGAAPAPAPPPAGPPDGTPALVDAWPWARPFRLDGWFERNAFRPVWAGVLVFVAAFLLFQVVGGVAVGLGVVRDLRGGGLPALTDTASLVSAYPRLILGGNALGQALAFGLVAWFAARLSTRQAGTFLRLRRPEMGNLGLAVLGWVAIYPVVLWLGELNARLPLPQWLEDADAVRGDMLEGLLLGGQLSTAFLFATIALTPAVFEEVLFRGYLQRQVERRLGTAATIVAVGVAFGLYHLSISQALPLSVLGVYLCFVVWATGSVWTGVLVHLLNNGTAVVAAGVARGTPGVDPDTLGTVGGPWYVGAAVALVGALALAALVRLMAARRAALTGGRPDAAPVPPDPSLAAFAAVLS